jgi:hypothetical protein
VSRSIIFLLVAVSLWVQAAVAQVRELPTPAAPGSLVPNLFAAADGRVYMSWIERMTDGRSALRYARYEGEGWSAPRLIAEGPDWFVNWADFPSLIALRDGLLAAHWLVKNPAAPHAYDVRIALSADGGESWSAPLTPHRDGTATEHGFVSLFAAEDGRLAAAWLDGRYTQPDPGAHGHGGGAMTLRYAAIGRDLRLHDEAQLDTRVCDCCQTSAASTAEGPLVVFRDRSRLEERDIAVVRRREGGWEEPRALPADLWRIEGCPVNGPAVAARGSRVAVAWFTAADDIPRVKLAFSADAGAGFSAPVAVDDGHPLGRVDAVLLDDGDAIVSWLESSPQGSSLRLRRIHADGKRGASIVVVPAGSRISNGFPQLARSGDTLLLAWTAERVRTAVLPVPAATAPP